MSTTIHRYTRVSLWMGAALSLILVACGDDAGQQSESSGRDAGSPLSDGGASGASAVDVEMTVGREGGTLRAEGVELTVPEGALDDRVEIRIREVPQPAELPDDWEASGRFYEITPHGLAFAVPITIELPYAGDEDESLNLAKLDGADDDSWAQVDAESFVDGVVTFETSSLSFYAVVRICPLELDSLEPGAVLTGCENRDCGTHPSFAVCGSCGRCDSGERCTTAGKCEADDASTGGAVTTDGAVTTGGSMGSGDAGLPPGVAPMRRLSLGPNHTCMLDADGFASCWGQNFSGQSVPPGGVAFVQIATSAGVTCGLDAGGTAHCWGGWDQFVGDRDLSPPAGRELSSVHVPAGQTCGLRSDGRVECWPQSSGPFTEPLPQTVFAEVALISADAGCGVRASDGEVECWPAGVVPPPAGVDFGTIQFLGAGSACGLRENDGEVECWLASGANLLVPEPPTGVGFSRMGLSASMGCGVRRDDGTLQCWGSNDDFGQLSPPGGRFSEVAVGEQHACAIREGDNALLCWGRDQFGQTTLPDDEAFTQVAAGTGACGIRAVDGTVRCWGEGLEHVPDDVPLTALALDRSYACGIRSGDGEGVCYFPSDWGSQYQAPAGTMLRAIDVAGDIACGLRTGTGEAVCWGSGTNQLGPPSGAFDSFVLTDAHGCWLQSGGAASCSPFASGTSSPQPPAGVSFSAVGVFSGIRESDGELLLFSRANQPEPAPPFPGVAAKAVAGDDNLRCILRAADGTAQCTSDSVPAAPPPVVLSDMEVGRSFSIGAPFACGVRAEDGVQVCWGSLARNAWK